MDRPLEKYRGDARQRYLISRWSALIEDGITPENCVLVLQAENLEMCEPPLPEEVVIAIATFARAEPPSADEDDEFDQVQFLLHMLRAHGVELFRAADGVHYVSVYSASEANPDPLRRTFATDEEAFDMWLSNSYMGVRGRPPARKATAEVQRILRGRAQFEGVIHPVSVRVGGTRDCVFIDLADDVTPPVVIDSEGWRFDVRAPVYFRQAPGLLPLPVPGAPRPIDDLRGFINVASDEDFYLVCACLVQAYFPVGPYPVLIIQGEQGSAKSTTVRIIRSLVDPHVAAIRSQPDGDRDLMIAARNSWILAYDNLSGLRAWLSDAFCRISTGGGSARRRLYSDLDEVFIDVQRPVMLNGIQDLATRGDLMDRAIVLNLPRLEPTDRQTEEELYQDFAAIRSGLVATLFNAVSVVIRERGRVVLSTPPRLADFARVGVATEVAFGWPAGAFLRAYENNRRSAIETVIEGAPIARAILALIEKGPWRGTATDLLTKLDGGALDLARRPIGWPRSPLEAANQLRRLAPALRARGIEVEFRREGKTGERVIYIRPPEADRGES